MLTRRATEKQSAKIIDGSRVETSIRSGASMHPILHLQRTIGNQAVQHLLRSRSIQAKLAISEPGDVHEQEADRVADQVMRMPEPALQRACSACATGGSPCPKCAREKEPLVQRKTKGSSHSLGSVPDDFLRDLGPGQPLDGAARAFFEPRFGEDFSNVRVHSYAAAEQSADEVSAQAYTLGSDIVFAAGRYAPTTSEGRRLIAHELTHVVQQSNAPVTSVNERSDGTGRSAGSISRPQTAAAPTLQRQERRSPGKAPRQGGVKSKPLRQAGSEKVSFLIHFDKPLTRSEFIELAEMTIYGRRTPGEWKGVPGHFKPSDSPVPVLVPAATLEPGLRASIAGLPAHIQNFLLANRGALGSYQDLKSVADAGFILATAGVTEDELELSLLAASEGKASDLVSWALTFVEGRGEQVFEVTETGAEEARQEKYREKIEHLTPDALRWETAEVVAALAGTTLSDSKRRAMEANLQILEEYASAQGFDLPEATAYRLRQVIMALATDLTALGKQLKEILGTEVGDIKVGEERGVLTSEFQPGAVWALEQLSWTTDTLSAAIALTNAAQAGGAQSAQQFRDAGVRVTAALFTSQAVAIHLAYLHVAVVAASDFGNPFVNRKLMSKVSIVREELEPLLQELRSFDPARVERAVKELRSPWHGFQTDFDSFVEDLQEHAHTMKRVRQVAHIISLAMMGRGLLARPGGGAPIAGGPGIGGMTGGSVAVARGAIGSVEWVEAMRQLAAIGAITTGAAIGSIGGGTAGELPMPAKPTLTAASTGGPPGGGRPPGRRPAPEPPVEPGPRGRVEQAGGSRPQPVEAEIKGEIGPLRQLVNRIRTDPQFRQEYIERLRRAGYTRERAQEVAATYERAFAESGSQEHLTQRDLWRLFADLL